MSDAEIEPHQLAWLRERAENRRHSWQTHERKMKMANYKKRPVDERGWRVPNEGTIARQVYDLLVEGLGSTEIAERLGEVKRANIVSYVWGIKNPTSQNAVAERQRLKNRKPKIKPAPPYLRVGERVCHSNHFHATYGPALRRGLGGVITRVYKNTRWVLWDGSEEPSQWSVGFLEPIATVTDTVEGD